MAMPRKARPEPASKEDVNTAVASARADAKQDFMKLAVELEKRPTRAEMREGFDAVNGRLDRMMGILDRTSGENFDIRRTLTIYDAMFGESRRTLQSHDRRLSALETRLPPTP